jgi:hypothetical protein
MCGGFTALLLIVVVLFSVLLRFIRVRFLFRRERFM